MLTRACLKKSFCKMCVPLCGRFGPDEGGVAGYVDRIGAKSPAKWGVQTAGMNFQTGSRANSSQSGLFRTTHTSSPSPPIPAKQSNQFQTTNYTSPHHPQMLRIQKRLFFAESGTLPHRRLGTAASFDTRCIHWTVLRSIGLIKGRCILFFPSGNFLVLVSPQLSHSYRSIRNSSFKYSR